MSGGRTTQAIRGDLSGYRKLDAGWLSSLIASMAQFYRQTTWIQVSGRMDSATQPYDILCAVTHVPYFSTSNIVSHSRKQGEASPHQTSHRMWGWNVKLANLGWELTPNTPFHFCWDSGDYLSPSATQNVKEWNETNFALQQIELLWHKLTGSQTQSSWYRSRSNFLLQNNYSTELN